MAKVSEEMAQKTINAWLDAKRVRERKREQQKDNIETLVDAVADGDLSHDPESNELTLVLLQPVGIEKKVEKLIFKPRINMGLIRQGLKGIKVTEDSMGYIMAYIATLTNQPKNVINALDSDDYKIASAIAGFFL